MTTTSSCGMTLCRKDDMERRGRDTHIIEHPGIWELFDPEMYQRRPVLASTTVDSVYGENNQVWLIDGMAVPKRFGKGSALVAVGGSDRENARTDIAASVRYVTDPEARVRDMDKRGVETEVVYPTLLLSYLEVDVALEVAVCQAYNRFLAEAWKTAGDRLRWVVVPPLRDMDASVREIETARDHGAAGVFFQEASRATDRWRNRISSPCTRPLTGWAWLSASTPALAPPRSPGCSTGTSATTFRTCARCRYSPSATSWPTRSRSAEGWLNCPGGALRLHRGFRLLGALHPAPPATGQRREAQCRRRRRRQPRLGPRPVPRLPALRSRGSRRGPALPAHPHRRGRGTSSLAPTTATRTSPGKTAWWRSCAARRTSPPRWWKRSSATIRAGSTDSTDVGGDRGSPLREQGGHTHCRHSHNPASRGPSSGGILRVFGPSGRVLRDVLANAVEHGFVPDDVLVVVALPHRRTTSAAACVDAPRRCRFETRYIIVCWGISVPTDPGPGPLAPADPGPGPVGATRRSPLPGKRTPVVNDG